jgi:hypothetical protein
MEDSVPKVRNESTSQISLNRDDTSHSMYNNFREDRDPRKNAEMRKLNPDSRKLSVNGERPNRSRRRSIKQAILGTGEEQLESLAWCIDLFNRTKPRIPSLSKGLFTTKRVLTNVWGEATSGQILAIMGPSGTSTRMRLAIGECCCYVIEPVPNFLFVCDCCVVSLIDTLWIVLCEIVLFYSVFAWRWLLMD